MEYWNIVIGIQPNTPAFHHSVHSPLSSTLICVIAISPAATEHIIERTGSAAYTSTNGSAFADIGMRRGADSRARCPANCRASQSPTTNRHEAQKRNSEVPCSHLSIPHWSHLLSGRFPQNAFQYTTAGEKKAHGKVRTVRCLARLKRELAGLQLLLRKNSTYVVGKIAEVIRSSNLQASVEVGTLYLQPRDTFAFVLGDAVSAQAG